MKNRERAFDLIMQSLKEVRAYRQGKLTLRDRKYLPSLLKAAPRPNERLVGGTDVRVIVENNPRHGREPRSVLAMRGDELEGTFILLCR